MLQNAVSLVWSPLLLGGFLAVGLLFSAGSGFFQLFGMGRWWRETLGSGGQIEKDGAGLSPFATLATALASTVGTGSIVGVATAITLGGPGAVLWMWVSAFLSTMTGWAEKALAILVRRRTAEGWQGGAMVWLEEKGFPRLAKLFALFTALAALGMGDLVQANSLASAVETAAGVPPLLTGLGTALLCGAVLMGGLKGIGGLCEKLVPLMGCLFLAGGLLVLAQRWERIPDALALIFRSALSPEALAGGTAGSALRWGVTRGVCTNEAGLGSTALVHCSSQNEDPMGEGCWGIVEVLCSTFVICSVTALVILTSDAWASGLPLTGSALSLAAFREGLGGWGDGFLALCLGVFAFSTLLGWCWYGCCAVGYLFPGRWERGYRWLFLLCTVLGSVGRLEAVWQLADLFNGLMAYPSLFALLLYAPELLSLLQIQERGTIMQGPGGSESRPLAGLSPHL